MSSASVGPSAGLQGPHGLEWGCGGGHGTVCGSVDGCRLLILITQASSGIAGSSILINQTGYLPKLHLALKGLDLFL